MSSEHVRARFSLRRVALLGGGRWSRVLLPVIQSLLATDSEIVWVTEHGQQFARRWLIDKGIAGVLLSTDIAMVSLAIDAAVVATNPVRHGQQVRELLERRIPTFCEKPFTLDFEEASALQQVAASTACPLGINLEMHFASFIEDFGTLIRARSDCGKNIRTLNIEWLDPWSDSRYGETKHGDIYTSIVDDMWPHCWSLLRKLCPGGSVKSIAEVVYEPIRGQADIAVHFDNVSAKVSLSRRSDRRVRRVDVNGGEAVLDFSTEPGFTVIDGVESKNAWRGERPLSRSLSSFFETISGTGQSTDRGDKWALSAAACLDSVRSAQMISDNLRGVQRANLDQIRNSGIDLADEIHLNLIVDLLLPEYAAKDRRWPAINFEDQITFARHVCETQGMRCR